MIKCQIVLTVSLPDDYKEYQVDKFLADAIEDYGGEILDSKNYIQLEDE